MDLKELAELARNRVLTPADIDALNKRIETFDKQLEENRSEITQEWLNKPFASL